MRRSCDFPLDPLSVGAARRFAVEALGEVSDEVLEAVQLMVSELATNSIRHARTGFELVVDRRPEAVRVEVTDLAGGVPEIQSPGPMDPTGRGLAIVEMFSDSWGVEYATPTNRRSGSRSRSRPRRREPTSRPAAGGCGTAAPRARHAVGQWTASAPTGAATCTGRPR